MRQLNRFLMLCAALVAFGLASCKDSSTNLVVSTPQKQIGQAITDSVLPASPVKGTLLSGHNYYFSSDIIVNAGDTLLMQSGVHLICIPPSNHSLPGPQISVYGTFISLGTKENPNWITVPESLRTYDNLLASGLWGGIQCAKNSGDLIVKWTHLEYVGGPSEPNDPINPKSEHRYGIWYQTVNGNFILEDSWIRGTIDDPVRVSGGRISLMRNTVEWGGQAGGDGFNIKSGTIGDIAYNLFIGDGTNGPKLSNKGGAAVQTNVNIYNNTIINGGWRMVETGRSGSTNIEEGARGTEYNNLIVNCRTGFRLVGSPVADTANTFYDYQYYYASLDSIAMKFYPSDGVEVPKPHDVAGAVRANDPMFVNYDVNHLDYSQFKPIWPIPYGIEPHEMNEQGSADFRLRAGSPCIGTALTTLPADALAGQVVLPMKAVPQGGDLGATSVGLGKDFGAYQTDGTGNQH